MSEALVHRSGWRMSALAMTGVLAAVAAKALLLFVAIPYFHEASPTTYQAERFPDWYDLIAMNVAEGHGYRFFPETTETMLRTPGWVLLLAGIFSVFGHSLAAVKAFNLLFSLLTACLTYVLGRRITGNTRLALVAAAIAFLHPAILVADSRGGVESLLTLAIVMFMLLVYRALETQALRDYLLAGIALGAALLIKSTPALFAPLLFLYLVGRQPTRARIRDAAIRTAVVVLAAGAVLSPWVVRNYALSGAFVPTMSVGGMAAFTGQYVTSHRHTGREQYVLDPEASAKMGSIAESMGMKFKPGYYPQFYSVADELKFYGHIGDLVKARYREQPSLLLQVIADNALGFWVRGRTMKATALNMALVLPFLALALWGTVAARRQSLPVGPILLFIAAFYAVHVAILGQARYHVPLIPLLAILACVPLRPFIGDVSGGRSVAQPA